MNAEQKTLNVKCDVSVERCEDGHFVPVVSLRCEGLDLHDLDMHGPCCDTAKQAKENGLKKAKEVIEKVKIELATVPGLIVKVLKTEDMTTTPLH